MVIKLGLEESIIDSEKKKTEKKQRNKGKLLKQACESFSCTSSQLRYSTISVSLQRLVKKKSRALVHELTNISNTIGVLQHISSLVVNRDVTNNTGVDVI